MMVEFSVLPIGNETHVGKYVAEAVKVVHESGIEYRLTPMGTILIGEWEPVMEIVRKCHEAVRQKCDRVMTKIKIDDLKDQQRSLDDKIESIEKILGFEVRK